MGEKEKKNKPDEKEKKIKSSEVKAEKEEKKKSAEASEVKANENIETVTEAEAPTATVEEEKEGLKDSEIIDLNNPESVKPVESVSKNSSANKKEKKKTDKNTVEFLLSKKKKKKIRNRIILLVIIGLIVFGVIWGKNKAEQTKLIMEAAMSNNVETATVESKTISRTVSATGQLLSADARTVTRNLNGFADIIEVNVEVGDYVQQGDVLVRFSTESVDKSITQTKEDISLQRQQDAIDKEDAERNYINSYKSAATNMANTTNSVETALENLHDACNAYGDAKRELQKIKDTDASEFGGDTIKEQRIATQQAAVDNAYKAQKTAQESYDRAVESQANSADSQASSLSSADSSYKKSQLNAGNNVKQLQRKLESYEDSLDDYIVIAPIDGVITAVNVSEGNSFSSGSVLTIQDLSQFEATVLVDEYDVPSVKSAFNKANDRGEELGVIIKTEATEDNEYKGHVVSIDPTSTSTATYTTSAASSGNSNSYSTATSSSSSTPQYKVKVMIDEPDEAFMMGMTAKVSIIVESSPEGSLCLPYNALEENSDGEFFVNVVDNPSDLSKNKDGIVVDKDENAFGGKGPADFAGNIQEIAESVKGKSTEEMQEMLEDSKPKTHEVKVKKIFDTDYYTAIVPVVSGELKSGDIVLINTDRNGSSNDFMNMMMGGPM